LALITNTPGAIELAITNQCNLHCNYCSHFTSAGDVGRDLAKEEWLQFFKELNQCAVMTVTLEGGEPFCREDLKELIDGIIQNRMRFNILSNGTLINDEIVSYLASTGRCDGVQVSVDGSTPATHDAFRGEGSFFKALNGIKLLQAHNVPVSVRVTIHRQNVMDLKNIAKLLLEKIGLSSFSTNAASYLGFCRRNVDEIQLTVEERSLAMENLLKLHKKYKGRINADAGPLADAINWLEMELFRREGKGRIPKGGYLTGCSGPMFKIGVRADGVIVPCLHLSHIELGQINKDDLKDIWQSHKELKRLRERHNIPLSDFEFCKGCDYIDCCTGNCPALAYTIVGKEDRPSPDACLRRFLESGGRLPDERLL
jgi:SynChlorMet cassette radical SAM/SPASM protein ScmE